MTSDADPSPVPPGAGLARRPGVRVAVHTAFALVVTWPLVWWLGIGVPNGTERPGTVAFFNLWTLRWNQHVLTDPSRWTGLFEGYWDAPIFHPEPGAFALSEPQVLTGAVFTPLAVLTGSPVAAYGLVVLVAVALNGLAAARLSRRLGVAPEPALLAGLLAQVLPFVMNEMGVLQLLMVFPWLFLADAVLAWAERPGWGRGLAVGAWLSATFLTCGYYGLFAVVIVGPAALVLVRRDWFSRRRLAQAAVAVALFGLTAGPALAGQARYTAGYERMEEEIRVNSAQPLSFVRLHGRLPGAGIVPWLTDSGGEGLYAGSALVILALAGAVLAVLGVRRGARGWRPVAFVGLAAMIGLVLSMGLNLDVFGWQPYQVVRRWVPGFDDLRSPFRAIVFFQAFLVPLAAIALDRLWSVWRPAEAPATVEPVADETGTDEPDDQPVVPGGGVPAPARTPSPVASRHRLLGPVLCLAVLVVGMAEVWPVSQSMVEVPAVGTGTDWVDWLADAPEPVTGDGAVAMMPVPASGHYAEYEATTIWMLAALDHGRPLVNGYSGLFPPRAVEVEAAVRRGFPSMESAAALEERGVSWVVVSRVWAEGEGRSAMADWSEVYRPVFEGRDAVIYAVEPLPG